MMQSSVSDTRLNTVTIPSPARNDIHDQQALERLRAETLSQWRPRTERVRPLTIKHYEPPKTSQPSVPLTGSKDNPTVISDSGSEKELEKETASKTKSRPPVVTSKHPPADIAPGQRQPYRLPVAAKSCPFTQCERYRHVYRDYGKLVRHMKRAHRWPKVIGNGHGQPRGERGQFLREDAPSEDQSNSAFHELSTTAHAPTSASIERAVDASQSNVTRQREHSHCLPDNQILASDVPTLPTIANSTPSTPTVSEDLRDVPIVPGQTEPYVLPDGIKHCPLKACPSYNHRYEKSWRVTAHMKEKHGWPLQREVEQGSTQSTNGMPSNNVVQSAGKNTMILNLAEAIRKRTSDGQLKTVLSTKNNAQTTPEPSPYSTRSAGPAPAYYVPSSASMKSDTPPAQTDSDERQLFPTSATAKYCSEKTHRLMRNVEIALRGVHNLKRFAGGKAHPWEPAEDELIYHLKHELNLGWTQIKPFLQYRGPVHNAQNRLSKMKRGQEAGNSPQVHTQSTTSRLTTSDTPSPSVSPNESPDVALSAYPDGSTANLHQPRRSERAVAKPGTFSRYFHLRPVEDDVFGDQEQDVKVESNFKKEEIETTLTTSKPQANNIEYVPSDLIAVAHMDSTPQMDRDMAAIGALTPRISRQQSQSSPSKKTKRPSIPIHKPYLSKDERDYLKETLVDWDSNETQEWDTQPLHVDFTETEMGILEQNILQVKLTKPTCLPLPIRLARIMQDTSAEDIDRIALRAISQGRFLNRTLDSMRSFLADLAAGQTREKLRICRLHSTRTPKRLTIFPKVRQRELGTAQHHSTGLGQIQKQIYKSFGPSRSFKGTSSDVNVVRFSPDGRFFAVGCAAYTDPNSMQYNRPNNLLLGDSQGSKLYELPHHVVERGAATGVNATANMQASQDPLLFTTISDAQFSSDGKVLITAGYDKCVRLWEVNNTEEGAAIPIRHRWSLEKQAEVDLIAMAPTLGHKSRLFAVATKTGPKNKRKTVKLYNYSLDDTGEIVTLDKAQTFSSRQAVDLEKSQLDPSCLRFGNQGRHLLGGYGARDDDEKRGEACLWDIETGEDLGLSFSRQAVFDVQWSPSIFGRFAIAASAVYGKVNRGTNTTIRMHDSRWLRSTNTMSTNAHPTIELECPAIDMNDILYNPRDEHLMAAGCTDGTTYVWDIRSPHKVLHSLGHGKPLNELDESRPREVVDTGVRFLSWDLNGRQLFTGSSDGIVACWDPYQSQQNSFRHELARMDSGIMAGCFSPDHDSLLLGDVQGTVQTLSVGRGDDEDHDCESFQLISNEDWKDEKRVQFRSRHPERSSNNESGKEIANELIRSGQIDMKPFGAFTQRQAVQGPCYAGPYDNRPDAQDLRRAALDSQAQARGNVNDGSARTEEVKFTDELVADQELWKQRRPHLMHEPPRRQGSKELDSCSRCFDVSSSISGIKVPSELLEDRSVIFCIRCGACWRADLLGYELIRKGAVPQIKRAAKRVAHSSTDPMPPHRNAMKKEVFGFEPVMTAPYLMDRFELDPIAVSGRD